MPAGATSSGLANRYATALFELAEDAGATDAVLADLEALGKAIGESSDLRDLIRSPLVGRAEQERSVVALVERASGHDLTRRFLGVLAQRRRLFALPVVIEAFRAKVAAARGQVEAEVISATPLGEQHLAALKEAVGRYAGAEVALQARVDPALIGGLVVRVGSRMVDASLRTRIAQLENTLKGIA